VEARRKAGLSQAALARKAGLPRSVLNAYERGHRQPGADVFAKILEVAGFEMKLTRRIDPERASRILSEVLDLAEALPFKPKRKLMFPPMRRRTG